MIKDKNTGALYDTRVENSISILTQQDEKLTKITAALENPWKDWWDDEKKFNGKLLEAAENGNYKQVVDLIKGKKHSDLVSNINTKGSDGYAPLHYAVSEAHIDMVKLFIKMGANCDAITNDLKTPLHLACTRGYSDIIEMLLQAKVNVNAQDKDGFTPIHYLAENGFVEGIAICLKCNPDFTIKNVYGETPIELASSVEVRQLLIPLKEYVKSDIKKTTETYTRSVINNLIIHNNRADTVKALIFRVRYLSDSDAIKYIPKQTKKEIIEKPRPKQKSRRIRIVEAAIQLSNIKGKNIKKPISKQKDSLDSQEGIGLDHFDIIQILGKGSFGEVYLVKYKPLDKPYAMKVLNKKRFISQNLLKYAKAERNVLCYTKSPFIVGLDFAFQSADKLFLILEYCPGYIFKI